MVRVGGGEEVVGDVSTDIVAAVRPLGLGGQASNVLDEALGAGQLASAVRVALDVVLAAGPRPLGVPGDAHVPHAVHVRALVALPRVRAPLVVIEVVPVARVEVVLAAEVLRPSEERQNGWEDERGLHLCGCGLSWQGESGKMGMGSSRGRQEG